MLPTSAPCSKGAPFCKAQGCTAGATLGYDRACASNSERVVSATLCKRGKCFERAINCRRQFANALRVSETTPFGVGCAWAPCTQDSVCDATLGFTERCSFGAQSGDRGRVAHSCSCSLRTICPGASCCSRNPALMAVPPCEKLCASSTLTKKQCREFIP